MGYGVKTYIFALPLSAVENEPAFTRHKQPGSRRYPKMLGTTGDEHFVRQHVERTTGDRDRIAVAQKPRLARNFRSRERGRPARVQKLPKAFWQRRQSPGSVSRYAFRKVTYRANVLRRSRRAARRRVVRHTGGAAGEMQRGDDGEDGGDQCRGEREIPKRLARRSERGRFSNPPCRNRRRRFAVRARAQRRCRSETRRSRRRRDIRRPSPERRAVP